MSAVIILLVADLLWHAMKTAIDRKLAESAELGQPNTEEARRRARLRTLLPIFRNILFVVVIAVAALMALAELGVEIGPLVAGPGIFGIAVGFGAQTWPHRRPCHADTPHRGGRRTAPPLRSLLKEIRNVETQFRTREIRCKLAVRGSRGTEGLQTLRWREMDSNFRYRSTKAVDFRSIPGIGRASAGSPRPIVRQPAIRR
jgi:hypothetical protein